jgi:hypothetical protein
MRLLYNFRRIVPEPPEQKQGSDSPELSMILVVGSQRERAALSLRSLLEQNAIDRMEILLFDLGPPECSALPGSDHSRVKVIRGSPSDLLGSSRAKGVRMAAAPVVGFIEEHCEMQPGAAEAMILAHRGPCAAVGCDLINGNPNAGRSDQTFRMSYGIHIRPQYDRGPSKSIAVNNSSYKRAVLLRYEPQLALMLAADLVLQWKMTQDGGQLFYEPAAKIAHRNEIEFSRLCVGVFYLGWVLTGSRAQVFEWSWAVRVLRIALSPLVPWVRAAKTFVRIWPHGPSQVLQFLRDLPFSLAINYSNTAGNVAGLLKKLETGIQAFSYFEINEPRPLRAELRP